jgi:hypothetical protein
VVGIEIFVGTTVAVESVLVAAGNGVLAQADKLKTRTQ